MLEQVQHRPRQDLGRAKTGVFFVRHGDIVGRISVFASLLLLLALIVRLIVRKR